jgi:nucleolar protein 12
VYVSDFIDFFLVEYRELIKKQAGPVKAPPKSRYDEAPPPSKKRAVEPVEDESNSEEEGEEEEGDDEELSSIDGDLDDEDLDVLSEDDNASSEEGGAPLNPLALAEEKVPRKRKRGNKEEDLEGKYLSKLAREEEKEEAERQAERKLKRQRLLVEQGEKSSDEEEDEDANEDEDMEDAEGSDDKKVQETPLDIPQHESLAPDKETQELEKATRTVFLANVSTSAITDKKAKKTLLEHMASFIGDLPPPLDGKQTHKVESIRFRSTAYEGSSLPKKAAFATKALMAATTKSTNAYVVYSTSFAAREAAKRLNGTMVLDRHLRVDGVAHPAKTDHRRCVFVGNLGFVDDESMMDEGEEGQRKRSKVPSDIEEGLWRQFAKAGEVESVRVVRDEKTRVGKGFAYVQFKVHSPYHLTIFVAKAKRYQDANAVEAALLFNEKKYPPMLPRILRVTRAKAFKKTANAQKRDSAPRPFVKGSNNPNNVVIYNPKMTSQQQSLQGRASKLLGKAGASQFRKRDDAVKRESRPQSRAGPAEGIKGPEAFIFEGYRASSNNGKPKDLKLGGKNVKSKGGKPKTKSAKRASEWKKSGGKKPAKA